MPQINSLACFSFFLSCLFFFFSFAKKCGFCLKRFTFFWEHRKTGPGGLFPCWLQRLTKTKINPFPFLFVVAVGEKHPCPGWQLPRSSRQFPATRCPAFLQPPLPFSILLLLQAGAGVRHICLCFILHRGLWQIILSCTLSQHLQKADCCSWVPGFCSYACLSSLQRDELPGTGTGGCWLLLVYSLPFVREAAQLVLTVSKANPT